MRVGIITQVRMESTRLPGKVLKPIKGKALLQYHIDRLEKTSFPIIIATTTNTSDDTICEYAQKNNLKYYRGSEQNVLARFYETATKFNLEVIIRVTSDCPFIDSHLIKNSLEQYLQINDINLYMSNCIERTFARGFDFEIFSYQLLKQAFNKAVEESDLEHVTPWIWKNKSGKVNFYHIKQNNDNSNLRVTVDTNEDFLLIQELVEQYSADKLSHTEIETILNQHPQLIKINEHIKQKKI